MQATQRTAPAPQSTHSGIVAAGTLLEANNARRGAWVQNCGQNPLFVKLGSGASTTDFSFVLPATSAANDNGTSAAIYVEAYSGIITCAGTSPRANAVEIF